MSTLAVRQRCFAPLKPELRSDQDERNAEHGKSEAHVELELQELEGVIFDVDGTLCCK